MNALIFSLAIIFMPITIPIVAFYVSIKIVLNKLNQFLEKEGAEL